MSKRGSNSELFAHENDALTAKPQFLLPADEVIHIDESVQKKKKIEAVLKSFKNNKSAGSDKLKTEGLKYNNNKNLTTAVMILLTMIWTTIQIPTTWSHSNNSCVHKKGAKKLAANYSGLSIGANMSRILAKIIINRLQKAY